ncbi:hypothetical protein BH11ARM1_BH11ARM1_00690 [soil metagenome]
MVLLIAAALAQTMTLTPSDDLWVYPHASDAGGDTFLRVWGVEGKSVPADAGEAEDFSMGYLRFSLAGTPSGETLKSATLELTNVAQPGFTVEQAKFAPLEARSLPCNFVEEGWTYEKLAQTMPKAGIDGLFGSGSPTTVAGETISISIDLLKGTGGFAKAFAAAQASPEKAIAIALTSPLNPAELGRSAVYKVYSNNEKDEKLRPKLVLGF